HSHPVWTRRHPRIQNGVSHSARTGLDLGSFDCRESFSRCGDGGRGRRHPLDVARDARWGRMAEGAGEDPFLGSAMAAGYVRGYQGSRLDAPDSIAACAKHYLGYGAAEGGRDYNSTEISEHTLRQFYMPPFHAAV